jgi:hypothetical protein
MTMSTMELDTECCYAKCHLSCVSFMLSVANKPFMLSDIILSVAMLSVFVLNVVAPLKLI